MAGEVPLVAKGGLAAVTLVGLVTVDLQRMSLERGLLGEPAVALVAEEGSVLWEGRERSNQMDSTWVTLLISYGMDLGWRRGAARASVGRNKQPSAGVHGQLWLYHAVTSWTCVHCNNMHGLRAKSSQALGESFLSPLVTHKQLPRSQHVTWTSFREVHESTQDTRHPLKDAQLWSNSCTFRGL